MGTVRSVLPEECRQIISYEFVTNKVGFVKVCVFVANFD